jgi:oligoendopeptidase F
MSPNKTAYQQIGWSLEDILASPEKEVVNQIVAQLEKTVSAIEVLRPALSHDMSGEDFAQVLKLLETATELGSRLGSYGPLWFSADTQSQDALGFMGKMDQLIADIQNRILFFSLWWKGLDDEPAQRLLEYAGDMHYYLEKDRLFKDHILTEPEEKIINIKDVNGINAIVTLYDMITSKFVFELEVNGEKKELTRDQLMTYVRNPSADIRAAAYQELYRVYQKEDAVLAQIYAHRVRDGLSENIKLRRFSSPIAVRNLVNDIPDDVVNTLLEVCAEQAPVFHRYFKLKAGWLNVPKLRRYDLYAPLSKKSDKTIDYPDAINIVLDSFTDFHPDFAAMARRIFDDNHIDSEIRQGKRGGAFCASILPKLTPWVLVNYTGEPRQVATLAHELGHAVHSMLAADHSVYTFHSALPMAETASVFSEMLLTDRLLAEEKDPAIRRDLLAGAIDDAYATVLRQAYFVIFERDAHQMVADGSTMEDLNKKYMENLQQQFGDSLDISADFQREWICIPHIFHTPFYCYAYSFGQLLSLSLYQQYKQQGDAFIPKLVKILVYGGSASPNHILCEVGVNMADPDFWRGGFKVIEGMIGELLVL